MRGTGFSERRVYFAYVIRLVSGACWPYKVFAESEGIALGKARVYGRGLGAVTQIHKVGACPHEVEASAHLFERACKRAKTLQERHGKGVVKQKTSDTTRSTQGPESEDAISGQAQTQPPQGDPPGKLPDAQ